MGDSFTDVPRASGFYRFVETLLHRGVTGGCGGASYCPTSPATRGQMAVFVLYCPADPVTREQMSVFITATFGLTL